MPPPSTQDCGDGGSWRTVARAEGAYQWRDSGMRRHLCRRVEHTARMSTRVCVARRAGLERRSCSTPSPPTPERRMAGRHAGATHRASKRRSARSTLGDPAGARHTGERKVSLGHHQRCVDTRYVVRDWAMPRACPGQVRDRRLTGAHGTGGGRMARRAVAKGRGGRAWPSGHSAPDGQTFVILSVREAQRWFASPTRSTTEQYPTLSEENPTLSGKSPQHQLETHCSLSLVGGNFVSSNDDLTKKKSQIPERNLSSSPVSDIVG